MLNVIEKLLSVLWRALSVGSCSHIIFVWLCFSCWYLFALVCCVNLTQTHNVGRGHPNFIGLQKFCTILVYRIHPTPPTPSRLMSLFYLPNFNCILKSSLCCPYAPGYVALQWSMVDLPRAAV